MLSVWNFFFQVMFGGKVTTFYLSINALVLQGVSSEYLRFLMWFLPNQKSKTYVFDTVFYFFTLFSSSTYISKWNTLYDENGSSWKYVSSVKKCRSSQKRIFRAKYFFEAYTTYTTIISFHFFLSLKEMHMKMMFCIPYSKKS